MAKHFAQLYNTEFVPEVARELISSNDFTLDGHYSNRSCTNQEGKRETEHCK